jgi:hypothetical protein
MCSRGGETITAGSSVDPFGNNDMIHRGESSLACGAATTKTTNNDAADAVLLPSDEFDEDCSSETEFDEDSCSETEFDVDSSLETEFDEDCSSKTEIDVYAVDFDGNDTNVYFIVKPFDDAAKKAELILNNTHARMKKQDKGPTTESEKAYLVTLKSDLVDLFRLGYGLVFDKCKRDDLGRHVYEPQPMVGPASKSAGCYKVVQVAGGNNKGRVKTG